MKDSLPLFTSFSILFFLTFAPFLATTAHSSIPNESTDRIEMMVCPTGDITLTSQADVDGFTTAYPGCTELLGSLIVGPSVDIVDLDALSVVTDIAGSLFVMDNPMLTNINVGLANLNTIASGAGQISITNNNNLSQIDLSHVSAPILQGIRIDRDSALTDLLLPPDFTSGNLLSIYGNPLLANISEFDSLVQLNSYLIIQGTLDPVLPLFPILTTTGGITIEDNSLITVLPPFASLTNITGGNLLIANNPLISTIDFSAVSVPSIHTLAAVQNDNLTDLKFPLDIVNVTANLSIFNNPLLANISELDFLESITGHLRINNTIDTALPLFPELTSIGSGIAISSNSLITALPPFASLTDIFGGSISFNYNPLLSNIDLSTVSAPSITSLLVWSNNILSDLKLPLDITTTAYEISVRGNPMLTNISEFDNLTSMGGALIFHGNDDPVLPLFPLLTTVGGLSFRSNPSITALPPFASLAQISTGYILIAYCPLITTVDLSTISAPNLSYTTIEFNNTLTDVLLPLDITTLTLDLRVSNNPFLEVINDFNSLETIGRNLTFSHTLLCEIPDFPLLQTIQTDPINNYFGGLTISNNSKITSIDKFPSLTFIDSILIITNNPLLSNCAIQAACDYLATPKDRNISGNAGDCLDEAALQNHCDNIPTILPPNIPTLVEVPTGTNTLLTITNLPANYEAIWYDSDMTTVLYQSIANNFSYTVNQSTTLYASYAPLGTSCAQPIQAVAMVACIEQPLSLNIISNASKCVSPGDGTATVFASGGAQSLGTGHYITAEENNGTSGIYTSSGDLDNDGDLDLYINKFTNPDEVWLNDGDGTFTLSAESHLETLTSLSHALGDLDSDGDLDVFISQSSGNNRILFNDGDGTFTVGPDVYTASNVNGGNANLQGNSRVALADLDGDGDLDAFVVTTFNQPNHVWINNGDGTFTEVLENYGTSYSYSLDLGDLDNDGDIDAFIANTDQANTVWLNDGDGTFTISPETYGTYTSYDIKLADFDGDNDLDAFVAGYGPNRVWLNDGDGTFTESVENYDNNNVTGLALADVDGDGDIDAFDAKKVYLNDGDGTFTAQPEVYQSSGLLALGDFDNDCDIDAFVLNLNMGISVNSVLFNDNSGITPYAYQWDAAAGNQTTSTAINLTAGTYTVSVTDAAGTVETATVTVIDPPDLTLATSATDASCALLNNGTATAIAGGGQEINFKVLQESYVTPGNPLDIELGDLDGDGDIDAFVTSSIGAPGGNGSVWLNDGDGTFTGVVENYTGGTHLELGDLDGDGDIDALFAGDDFFVYFNDGDGTYTIGTESYIHSPGTPPGNFTNTIEVALGDYNMDGFLDVFTANNINHLANQVWLNDGDGTFTLLPGNYGYRSTNDIVSADFNGNGILDIFAANSASSNTVYFGNGDGTFALSSEEYGTSNSSDVEAGDLDNDGDIDVFVTNAYHNEYNKVWLNDGDGTFTEVPEFYGLDAGSVALGDINGDGFLDAFIVQGSLASTITKVWLNDGDGTFTEVPYVFDPAGNHHDIELADLDGDGDVDAFSAMVFDRPVWLNEPNCYTYLWNTSDTMQTITGLDEGEYTVIATDASGCTVAGALTISAPTPTCIPNITIPTNNFNCQATINISDILTDPTACEGLLTFTITDTAGDLITSGSPPFTIDGSLYIDENLNIAVSTEDGVVQCNSNLTIVDNTPPAASCSPNIIIGLPSSGSLVLPPTAINVNSFDNCGPVTMSLSQTDFSCDDKGPNTVILTVTDQSGNSSQCFSTVTIADFTAPTFTLPPDVTIQCSQNPNDLSLTGSPTFLSDNCDPNPTISFSDSDTLNGCGGYTGTIARHWIAEDDCNNITSQTQLITVIDNTAPTFTIDTELTIKCTQYPDSLDLFAGTPTMLMDNCDNNPIVTSSDVISLDSCGGNTGTVTRTWTATDVCGNASIQTQIITIQDTTDPIFTAPGPVTLECDQDPNDTDITGIPTFVLDNCDNNPIVTSSDEVVLDGCGNYTGTITRTWTATDACGNDSLQTQIITIQDTTNPTFTVPGPVTLECSQYPDSLDILAGMPTNVLDNCDNNPIVTAEDEVMLDGCGDYTGTITRTWTVTDACGNDSLQTQVITILDTTDPTFTVPDPVTLSCEDDPNDLTLTSNITDLADNCDPNPTAVFTDDVSGLTSCNGTGEIIRTWTLTDACGNSTSQNQIITIVDNTNPTFTVPGPVTLECSQYPDSLDILVGLPTNVLDNCDSNPIVTSSDVIALDGCGDYTGTITRTWTVTDACGNDSLQTQIITIQDSTDPTFTVPDPVTLSCEDDPNDLTLTSNITDLADNCDPNPTAVFTDDVSGLTSCNGTGEIIRTWTLTDACGNSTSQNQIITIVDNTNPTFTVPGPVTLECSQYPDSLDILVGLPTNVLDNCDSNPIVTSSDVIALDGCGDYTGTITRTWTVTDACGNDSLQTQIITIQDSTDPTFTVPDPVTLSCEDDPNDLTLTSNITDLADNCDPNPTAVFTDDVSGLTSCNGTGEIIRTWTLTDACGNSTSQNQIITIVDNTNPTFTVPGPVTLECSQYPDSLDILAGMPTNVLDNCDNNPIVTAEDEVMLDGCGDYTGTITRTWTVTDACGNDSIQTQVITILDTTDPTFTVPGPVTLECDQDPDDTDLTGLPTNLMDNCDSNPIITSFDSDTLNGCGNYTGTITRSWTVTDICGNANIQIQVITIVDTTNPTFIVPSPVTLDCDQDINDTDLTGVPTNISDNCDSSPIVTYSDVVALDGCGGYTGTVTRTWAVTDDCDNASTAIQIITVGEDTSPPVFTTPPAISISCNNIDDLNITGEPTNVMDACDAAPTTSYSDVFTAGECGNTGTIIRTWLATDGCNNSSSSTQTITVIDNEAPTIGDLPGIQLTCFESLPPAITTASDFIAAGGSITDDCTTEINDFTIFHTASSNNGSNCPGDSLVIVRTYYIQDACGTTATSEHVFTYMESAIGPEITGILPATYAYCGELANPEITDLTYETDCNFGATVNISGPVINGSENCPGTVYQYTYIVTDDCGRSSDPMTRDFIIDNEGPTITAPPFNLILTCGDNNNLMHIAQHLDLATASSSCDLESNISYSPQDFNTIACGNSTVVTFTVTDACGRIATATTTVAIQDNTAPIITNIPPNICDVTVCNGDVDYWWNHWVNYMVDGFTAEDACSAQVTISAINPTLNTNCVNGLAESVVTFAATDNCGNSTTITGSFFIENPAPEFTEVPIDQNLACGTPPSFGTPIVQDNCSTPNIIFIDEVFGDNCTGSITRTWTATDDCGNTATASSTIVFAGGPPPAAIEGSIATEFGEGVNATLVSLGGNAPGMSSTMVTTGDGHYGFYGLPLGYNYTVTPHLDENPLNGVSTWDLVLISKHILETQLLDSPYKMIAADINRSGQITTLDIVELRKLILFINNTFPNNTSWRFVEADYIFSEPDNPFSATFPELATINDLQETTFHDFVGVKIGDVNGSAVPNFQGSGDDRTFNETLDFSVKEQQLVAGETYDIAFKAKDFNAILGFQFSLGFDDTALDFMDYGAGVLSNLNVNNFGWSQIEQGIITSSWHQKEGAVVADGETLFHLKFKALNTAWLSDVLEINSRLTPAEAYQKSVTTSADLLSLKLHFEEESKKHSTFALYQNIPNPFLEETLIRFQLPEATQAELKVFDASGRLLWRLADDFEAGVHGVNLSDELQEEGLLYYQLVTPKYNAIRKMMHLK